MSLAKASVVVFVAVALLTTLFMVRMSQGEAVPIGPTDQAAVPHYFGPWPNWVLSPLTLPDATVTITDPGGIGAGATATATVGGNGTVTGITITNPGSGYTAANVSITGAGTGATATATVTNSGAVVSVKVDVGGTGYVSPTVTFSGGGATTQATGTAYGSVKTLTIGNPGSGYTMPTVGLDAPDDPAGTQATASVTWDTGTGEITGIDIVNPGSGYLTAPAVVIRDGTLFDPIINGGAGASATSTLEVSSVTLDTFGAGYTSAPIVTFADAVGNGSGATGTATVDNGVVSTITLTGTGGTGYVTPGGIKKFQDELPGLCDPASLAGCPTGPDAKFIPLGVPHEKTYPDASNNNQLVKADEYEIAVVQYRTRFNTDLPPTLVRGYVQLETAANAAISQHYPLVTEKLDGTSVPILDAGGNPVLAVTRPQWLGPTIAATKDKPVRIVFHNLLPTGQEGDLFLPTDSTLMGSGMGPMGLPEPLDENSVMDGVRNPICTEFPKSVDCFKDNRATLHLHGGITPWISDGTPHQWITPANEDTPWPQGVSVQNVPDMDVGNDPTDGVQTFYYTNQQSARLMFYHDHAWGITRLNVYAGEAAGYLISDDKEKELIASNTIPGPADTIPIIVQDRTFVPQDTQIYDQGPAGNPTSYGQDPTWDQARWGGYGNFWYHHVYMPAQNPGDAGGMSAYGRWMYGPWFWPPAAATKYGPIPNPYYDAACDVNDPATWKYQVDPFCEPAQIPGTPNISAGMEQFNDTPIVNGVAYPEVTLEPKTYRLRMLNAANDRFFNFQWYVADPTTGTDSEVALNAAELAAAQTDPVVFPTPVENAQTSGPDWIQIGSEGGFLPTPTVVDGQQETTWITDPTRFDVGNVDLHSLLLSPAERADVIVDFSRFAGKTLILYNDAPAAFPARVPSYDYYTGGPDLSPVGAPTILPGYGPNTRTIMRVKISAGTPAPAFNLSRLNTAFAHKTNGSGVFESSQHPIIVGQAAYNRAYGTSFAASSNCNPVPNATNPTFQICDGFVRVNDTMTFGFNTLKKPTTKTTMALQPKAIHDEMNATTFDEFGRMQANLGVEAQPPTPGVQNGTFYPYVNPQTELIDGTNLPKNIVTYDANGDPVSDVKITPVSSTLVAGVNRVTDGSQIWRITHNGVDTHPIHFHLYDVQLLNRVTWDNIVIPTEPAELGWKETIRVAPLEDTIVALRPIVPQLPWEVPNAIRNMNPMDPTGSTKLFNNVDPQGNPTTPIVNSLVNFGWEYVYHCHILSHEEMDMMRPVTLAMPPVAPSNLAVNSYTGTGTNKRAVLTWNDNSITETSFLVQRSTNLGVTWTTAGTITRPLDQPNTHGTVTFTDPNAFNPTTTVRYYRVLARNAVAYVANAAYPTMTVQSNSNTFVAGPRFTITASAAAGGSISPSGGVIVGRGGSQTFTITPNAGFRIAQVLVQGVNNPAAVASGTYTFTNLQANRTISATFTQSQLSITSSAGAGGRISPNGTQTVPIGGSQTYTITPNNGYSIDTVLVDGVNDPTAVTSGTYTFAGVTQNHTIAATFTANLPSTISVTAPVGTVGYAPGDVMPVSWTVSPTVATGDFSIWLRSSTGAFFGGKIVAATGGGANYDSSIRLNVPVDTGYVVCVYYRAASTDPWGVFGQGTGTVDVASFITVTAPTGASSLAQGSGLPIAWSTNQTGLTGQFSIWAMSAQGIFYGGKIVAATPASLDYLDSLTLNMPVDTGYSIFVFYRALPTDPWGPFGQASASIDVTTPNAITVTAPGVGITSVLQGATVPVTWTTVPTVGTPGEFSIWLRSSGGVYFGGNVVPANGANPDYVDGIAANVPVGVGYTVYVYYRATPTDPWGVYGASSGTVTVL
jgi:FtsP/CotA-like multicopper oxidase with cupredoxin domain